MKVDKPCKKLNYCPYGTLVEEYPLNRGDKSCNIFGHDCPVYELAEDVTETIKPKPEDL